MKAIFWAVSGTLATVAVVVGLYLNAILGLFGLAATSIDALQELRSSKQVVEQMKQRHQGKQASASKRLVKRSAQRIGSTIVAAATVGTVAVTAVMVGLEVDDYCAEKQSLHDDESILYGTDNAFNIEQCLEEGREELARLLVDTKDTAVNSLLRTFRAQADEHSDP
jgi:Na+/glutamate symporter